MKNAACLTFLVICCLGCSRITDDLSVATVYLYINDTQHVVTLKLTNYEGKPVVGAFEEKVIFPGDTVQCVNAEFQVMTGPFLTYGNDSLAVTLQFSGDTTRCLIFSGKIEDKFSDIRSPLSYLRSDENDYSFFKISDAHRELAYNCETM